MSSTGSRPRTGPREWRVRAGRPASPHGAATHRSPSAEAVALGVAAAALAAAFLAEPLGWWGGNVHQWLPPLSAHADPAAGPGLPVALGVAAAVVVWGPAAAQRVPWRRLLALTWAAGAVWGAGLALVRGWAGGIVAPLAGDEESLVDVPRVHGVGHLLRTYTDHILLGPHAWVTYDSGHPPLPLLGYAALDRVGLGGAGPSGVVVALVASTGVVAVLVALRALGDEAAARAAAPHLALTPLVIWTVVSTDGASMAVVAWGVALLALAARAGRPAPAGRAGPRAVVLAAAGLVLGAGTMLSYGLVLMAPVALAVLLAARTWRPLVPAVVAALAVVAAFAAGGFWWVEGERILVVRYYQGKGRLRPYSYWVWADLAVAAFAVGPAVVAGLGATAGRLLPRRVPPPATCLALGAVVAVLAASATGLSKSEVERIWLPFLLWTVPLAGRLPAGRQRWWLTAGAAWALAVEVCLRTTW